MKVLRKLLEKAIQMIDDGECDNVSVEDLELISILINHPTTMGREAAAEFLGVNLNEFHKLRRDGIICEPRKVVGFKELHYYTSDLRKSKQAMSLINNNIH